MKSKIIVLPCSVRNPRKTFEWEIPLDFVLKIKINSTDASTEADARLLAIALAKKLQLRATLGGIPFEASFRDNLVRANADKSLFMNRRFPIYLSALALLDPVTDLISLYV